MGGRWRVIRRGPRSAASASCDPAGAGFTLLEVLVALAIAIPALMLMYRQGTLSVEASGAAAHYQEALSRARSRLDALVDTALAPGIREGDDGGLFRWRTRIVPLTSLGPPREPPRNSPYAQGTTLFAVSVQVSWPGPRGEQSVTLDSRRLGPAAGAKP